MFMQLWSVNRLPALHKTTSSLMPLASLLGRTCMLLSQAAPVAARLHCCRQNYCEQIVAEGLPYTGVTHSVHVAWDSGAGQRSCKPSVPALAQPELSEKDRRELFSTAAGAVRGKRFVLAVLRASLSNKVLQLQAMVPCSAVQVPIGLWEQWFMGCKPR